METAKILIYDGSFNGFLTSIYRAFEEKEGIVNIHSHSVCQNGLFSESETVATQIDKAKRVWNGIQAKSHVAIKNVYFAFLSGSKGIELLLFRYICKMFFPNQIGETDFTDEMVHKINHLAKSVGREKQFLETFMHFHMTVDGNYYATIDPEFDVLPLLSKHFRSRYSDQPWIIYDIKRKYGLFYDMESIEIITKNPQEIFEKNVFALANVKNENLVYEEPSSTYAINSSNHCEVQGPYATNPYPNYLNQRKAV